jgi:hypothetical protein
MPALSRLFTAQHFRPPFFGNIVLSALTVNCISIMEYLALKEGGLFLANFSPQLRSGADAGVQDTPFLSINDF